MICLKADVIEEMWYVEVVKSEAVLLEGEELQSNKDMSVVTSSTRGHYHRVVCR